MSKLQRAPTVREFNDLLDKLGVTKNATEVSIKIGVGGIPSFTVTGLVDVDTWKTIAEELPLILSRLEAKGSIDPASVAPLQSIQESKPGDGPHTPPIV